MDNRADDDRNYKQNSKQREENSEKIDDEAITRKKDTHDTFPDDENSHEEYPDKDHSYYAFPDEEDPHEEYLDEDNHHEIFPDDEDHPYDAFPGEEDLDEEDPYDAFPDEEDLDEEYPNEEDPDEEDLDEEYPYDAFPDEEYPDEEDPNDASPDGKDPDKEYPYDVFPDEEYPDEEDPNDASPDEEDPDEEYPDEDYPYEEYSDEGNHYRTDCGNENHPETDSDEDKTYEADSDEDNFYNANNNFKPSVNGQGMIYHDEYGDENECDQEHDAFVAGEGCREVWEDPDTHIGEEYQVTNLRQSQLKNELLLLRYMKAFIKNEHGSVPLAGLRGPVQRTGNVVVETIPITSTSFEDFQTFLLHYEFKIKDGLVFLPKKKRERR